MQVATDDIPTLSRRESTGSLLWIQPSLLTENAPCTELAVAFSRNGHELDHGPGS